MIIPLFYPNVWHSSCLKNKESEIKLEFEFINLNKSYLFVKSTKNYKI